jgi:DNA-directed RNA polymerase subunit alpha
MANEIILPSQFTTLSETTTSGVYEIGGLYPGYGHTLGNSIRRVILSSLPGSAITMIKIEGVDHEFSTYQGMKEDVLAFILNLKKVRARLVGTEEVTVTLSVKGQKVVTAADITADGSVELANPDQYLCELTDKNASLECTVTFASGIGFMTRDAIRREKLPVGTIVLDSIFSPIRKVSYEVENMRVGDRTDYNRLQLSIETDGTITPSEALSDSLRIMITQLKAIANLKEEDLLPPVTMDFSSESPSFVDSSEEEESVADVLKTRIDSLGLSTRVMNALTEANIRTLGGLVRKSEDDLLDLEGFGSKGLEEIKSILVSFDLKLKD